MAISDLLPFCKSLVLGEEKEDIARPLLNEIVTRLSFLKNVGVAYLTLKRTARTLSGGEGQRIRLATQIGSALSGVLYVLDEPSIGLHRRDNNRLIETLKMMRDLGNTVVVVEHDLDTIKQADYVVDIGPGAGVCGGHVIAFGTPDVVAKNKNSITGAYISGRKTIPVPEHRRRASGFIEIKGACANNLKKIDVDIPVGVFCAVSGVSGSGKSSLVINTLARSLAEKFREKWSLEKNDSYINCQKIVNADLVKNVVMVDQSPIGRTPRSNPATYLGIFSDIRNLFTSLPESVARGYKSGRFSFNVSEGRCFECSGEGVLNIPMHFLEDVVVTCKSCGGKRYNQQTLEINYKGKNIYDILKMPIEEAKTFFATFSKIHKRLELLCDVGLGYVQLGQSSVTFSGGEAQRIKLVNELAKYTRDTMYILDEPTTGLHNVDIEKLLLVINRLIDCGNSVVIIEHNLDVLKSVDYLIDLGPEGGNDGGYVIAAGTPDEVAQTSKSITGTFLKKIL